MRKHISDAGNSVFFRDIKLAAPVFICFDKQHDNFMSIVRVFQLQRGRIFSFFLQTFYCFLWVIDHIGIIKMLSAFIIDIFNKDFIRILEGSG